MSTASPAIRETLTTDIVVLTAAKIADSEGLDAVTLTRVADELGVQQPALYRHVDGYPDLMRRLGLMGREVLVERLTECAVGRAGDDAVEAMGHAWRKMVRDHPGIYAATDRSPCAGDPELESAVDRVVSVLSQALVAYDLSEDAKVHTARTLRSAFHGFAHLESGDGHPHPQDTDESFRHLIALLCAGIAHLSDTGLTDLRTA
jgi:AcrR family transcriptional regulator